MASYPVIFDVKRPEKFERPQLALRLVVMLIMSLLPVLGLAFLFFPAAAAILISQKGPQKYLEEDAPRVTGWLRWFIALYAYLWMTTDRFPSEKPEEMIRLDVQPGGTPSVGNALLRIILAIPSAFVLGVLWIVGFVIWIIAFVMVIIQENYADGMYNYMRGLVRWQARLMGYMTSLVEPYPPFALDMGEEAPTA